MLFFALYLRNVVTFITDRKKRQLEKKLTLAGYNQVWKNKKFCFQLGFKNKLSNSKFEITKSLRFIGDLRKLVLPEGGTRKIWNNVLRKYIIILSDVKWFIIFWRAKEEKLPRGGATCPTNSWLVQLLVLHFSVGIFLLFARGKTFCLTFFLIALQFSYWTMAINDFGKCYNVFGSVCF